MPNPAAAVATSSGRYYDVALPGDWLVAHPPSAHVRMTGTTAWVPSVTNVLDQHAKPGLTWWAAGEVATYVLSESEAAIALVGSALGAAVVAGDHPCKGCGQPTDRLIEDKGWWMHASCEKSWKELRKVFNTKREQKANLGSLVHALVERHVLGEPVVPADYGEASGHVASWLRFVDKYAPTFLMSEATVFNLRYGYAGTLDLIMDVGGQRWITDLKSSPRVYFENALQLTAYRHAEGIYVSPGVVEPMPAVDAAAVLLLGEDRYKFEPVEADADAMERGFLPLLTLHRFKEDRGVN